MDKIDELYARESIRDLINRYCIEADRGRLDAVQNLFADNGVYVFSGREYTGRQGIVELFTESGRRVQAAGLKARAWHNVTSSAVDVTGDTATARTYVVVLVAGAADHWGYYDDEFRCVDGRWFIARREFKLQGFVPGGIGEVLK
ncbi:Ring hydroxylating enzyme beta subunit [Mycolicibacterium phlei]|uniref:SnoaL-like domain-containing protein n=2 Tax=Mycolicibacterium TaxID=1866885 RepID=A0A5N5UYS4_MYCPH|nr:nuclear transport factor 2 family protein [Mycolicibacterium phlei]VEG11956.1 Ring hydroxylating enzyme beta subunit [Mycobacteroides chelonae]AMO63867.1 hypothetical protein MPHLCCUG_05083 [Mycolicibacterium phlei]KAB7754792.1 hypothetical protein MPHL21000_16515 [Mycolicibacterium phlei DSM 43239 = CCUG 21000]KXW65487.1 hypothetical protein MPHL43239_12340 [Mycolicibacterium phlei DSM 43239 = CCUG 21000]KXW69498.1 hypothetical protein MPHL43070_18745 [Mycolicibacterium phlei DSM 43070]